MTNSLFFVAFASAWLLLPLIPAFNELRRPTDDSALDVFQGNAADVNEGLHQLLPRIFAAPESDWAEALSEKKAQLWLQEGLAQSSDVTCLHLVRAGLLRVTGGPLSVKTLHAQKLHLIADLVTSCRMSATTYAVIDPGVKFQVLQAPLILTGPSTASFTTGPHDVRTPTKRGAVKNAKHYPAQEWWRAGADASVEADVVVQGDILAEGSLVIGKGARIEGSLKTKGTVVLEEGAVICGNIVAQRVLAKKSVSVLGSILADDSIVLEQGTIVGTPARPASVVCSQLTLHSGIRLHGGICANTCAEVVSLIT